MTDPDDPRHGVGTNLYTNHRCRCDLCRAAWATYCQQRKFERAVLLEQNPDIVEHGLYTTYSNWSCRCRPCADAWATYYRELKKEKRKPA